MLFNFACGMRGRYFAGICQPEVHQPSVPLSFERTMGVNDTFLVSMIAVIRKFTASQMLAVSPAQQAARSAHTNISLKQSEQTIVNI